MIRPSPNIIRPFQNWARLLSQPLSSFAQFKPSIDATQNYYEKLKVDRTATLVDIKKSYYQLIKKSHPDFHKGHEDKFKDIKQAYQILSNYDLRKQYDQMTSSKVASEQTNSNEYKQERASGSGPYQTEEQYRESVEKGQYNLSKAEWHKTRIGVKQQSYISMQSNLSREKGVQGDQEIMHFHRKAEFLAAQAKENSPSQAELERIKARSIQLRRRHLERVKRIREAEEEKTMIGRTIKRLRSIFYREGSSK